MTSRKYTPGVLSLGGNMDPTTILGYPIVYNS